MASRTLSVTISDELYQLLDEQSKAGHSSRSEVVREALRRHFSVSSVDASPEEIEAIEKGREAFRRRDFVTLEEFLKA